MAQGSPPLPRAHPASELTHTRLQRNLSAGVGSVISPTHCATANWCPPWRSGSLLLWVHMAMAAMAAMAAATSATGKAARGSVVSSSAQVGSSSRSLQRTGATAASCNRRVFQVSATAAQSESVPPPTPEADITPAAPPKPTLKKGQIVRVDKEKYLNSVEYLSVGHPPYFTGLDYIYEDRGEVLNIRFFDHGEYALIAWAGIPTSPAWLPTYMLIKADRLSYKRQ